jgi:hypothetical protein
MAVDGLQGAVYVRAVPQPLPRAFRRKLQALDQAKLDRIIAATEKAEPSNAAGSTAGGDERRLRGLPAIGRGVRGAIAGTVPGERLG